jgi:hypothetical protein
MRNRIDCKNKALLTYHEIPLQFFSIGKNLLKLFTEDFKVVLEWRIKNLCKFTITYTSK